MPAFVPYMTQRESCLAINKRWVSEIKVGGVAQQVLSGQSSNKMLTNNSIGVRVTGGLEWTISKNMRTHLILTKSASLRPR
jgi:hypothetical protein